MFRAMLRGLLAHKLRLILSALAIVLGTMFMSAAFVAGDTVSQGFVSLFSTATSDLDVQVTGRSTAGQQSDVVTALVSQRVADQVAKVDGVAASTPQVMSDGARVIDKQGKVVPSAGPPRFGTGWTGTGSLLELREGAGPAGPGQIALSAGLAKTTGYRVGDRVEVITLQPRKTFTVSGIFGYPGGRDSLGGETVVAFTMPVAQQLMLGKLGSYTSIDVKAADGVSQQELKSRIEAAVGPDYTVQTAAESAKTAADDVQTFVDVLKTGLTVFAVIGLITGVFLIFNTFSMLVAQRTRELALYRAFGASRGQVNRSVLAESALLGLVSAAVGLAVGIGVGWLLKEALEAFSKTNLPVNGVVVKPYVVITALLVGVAFTMIAALIPALRAARVPPIAAMRDAATPDKPLRRLSIAAAVALTAGIAFLVLKLVEVWEKPLWLILGGGALLVFIGAMMLAPALSRPVTRTLGAVFGGSVPGRLGTRNTGRNPRRTAVTAAALMIGVTLATAAGLFASSVKAGVTDLFKTDMKAQLIVQADFTAGPQAGFAPQLQQRMRAIPGVTNAVAVRSDQVKLGGQNSQLASADPTAAAQLFTLRAASGQLRPLTAGEIILDEGTAERLNATVGSVLPMTTARGGASTQKVVAILASSQTWNGPMLNGFDAGGFTSPNAQAGYVQVGSSAQVPAVRESLKQLVADNPEVSVIDQQELLTSATSFLDIILTILNVLLGLTILVAVLGVINTLLLSVYERTREIGMIRAIGMSRSSTSWMITVESVLISLFGALLGVVVGVGLGIAAVEIFGGDFLKLTIPWSYIVVTLILAVIAGVFAAILPAIRASRLNVLQAIAYE